MLQLTIDDLPKATAGLSPGSWVMAAGPRALVGITTGRVAAHNPERVVVIGCSLTAYRWGCPPRPREVYPRPEDLQEIDPADLPTDVVAAVETAWQEREVRVCSSS